MGFNSQSGQMGCGIQTVKGTPVAATRFMKLRSGSLGGDRSLLIPDPEIGGSRDVNGAYLGPVSFGGDIEFYPRAQMIAMLLYGVLGAKASTFTTPVGAHVLTPAATLPWYTFEETIGNDFETLRYTDCKVNSVRLEAESTGYLMGSANVLGMGAVSGFTKQATPDWDETPMMVGSSITVSFNSVALPSKSFSLEVNNNIENDDFVLGSVFLDDLTEKRRSISMSLSHRPKDAVLWKAALWGDTGQTQPQKGAAYEGPVNINIQTYEEISAGNPFEIDVAIPHAVIAPARVNPSGDDVLGLDLELTVIRPSAGTPAITITVTNDLENVE